jgi:hypothetical protein
MTADEAITAIRTFGYAEGRRLKLHAGDNATRRRASAAIRDAFAIATRARAELARLEAEVAHSEATAYRYAEAVEAVETVKRILGEEGS